MYISDNVGAVLLRDLARGMHRFTINCKLSGGIALSTGIKNNVTIIHGPQGCAFQQRIPVMRDLDARMLVCTNLDENDTVFGGERKLAETISQVDKTYQPELITVLLTCATGIIGDDAAGVIADMKKKVKAKIIWADTSGFSHRDLKDSAEKLLKDQTDGYRHPRRQRVTLIQGCGQEELFKSMVEQLMEEPETYGGVDKRSAFYMMPTRWFGQWWTDYLREISAIFGAGGIRVGSISFNKTSVDEIRKLPQYHLNLKGYGKWAKIMKEKFGTGYLPDVIEYYNSPFRESISSFYLDSAKILGVEQEVKKVVEKRLSWMEKELKPYREVFEGKRLAVIRGWSHWGTPYLVLSQIFNLGFKLVYLDLDYDHIYDWNIDRGIIEQHLSAIRKVFSDYKAEAEIKVEATIEEEIDALKRYKPDMVITSFDRKWIPHSLGIPCYVPYTFSFYRGITGAVLAAKEIYQEYTRGAGRRVLPIYVKENKLLGYDRRRYPIPRNLMPAVKLWEEVRFVEERK